MAAAESSNGNGVQQIYPSIRERRHFSVHFALFTLRQFRRRILEKRGRRRKFANRRGKERFRNRRFFSSRVLSTNTRSNQLKKKRMACKSVSVCRKVVASALALAFVDSSNLFTGRACLIYRRSMQNIL